MSDTFQVVIHHNPDCGTSRNVVDIVQAAGYQPILIEYLQTGWTRPGSSAPCRASAQRGVNNNSRRHYAPVALASASDSMQAGPFAP